MTSELRRRVQEVDWYHAIDLGGGVVTPGHDHGARLEQLRLPADLSGMSVLDVGAYDGFFSFECERRGADRVVAMDSWAWQRPDGKRGFELARDALGSSVEDLELEVLDLSPETAGTFDVVLFLGVLYHMRHPLLALERAASVTAGTLVVETEVDLTLMRRPAAAFYPGRELNQDPTNWWGPNAPAVVGMLRAVGFAHVKIVSPNSLPYRLARAANRVLRRRGAQRGRLTVQAAR